MGKNMTTYEFYRNEYYGNKVDEAGFLKWLSRAVDELNYLTNNQIDEEVAEAFTTQIQKAVCALIDALFLIDKTENEQYDTSSNGKIKSMSSGGESVTFADQVTAVSIAIQSTQGKENYLYEAIRKYLYNTGLLFQGV